MANRNQSVTSSNAAANEKDDDILPCSSSNNNNLLDGSTTSPSQLRHVYDSKGYLSPITVLTREEATTFRHRYEAWVQSLPPNHKTCNKDGCGMPLGNLRFKPHLFLPFVNDVAVRNTRLLDVVKTILGTPNILLWSSDFNCKPPNTKGFFAPHQDATYTGLSPAHKGVTVWLAISEHVDQQSGCLAMMEGSHLYGQIPHIEEERSSSVDKTDDSNDDNNSKSSTNLLSRNQRIDFSDSMIRSLLLNNSKSHIFICKEQLVPTPLRAGQASLHHFHLVHASGPNRSDRWRVGLALRYIAASVVQKGQFRESVTLVSGKIEHDGFQLEPVLPPQELATDADIIRGRAIHAESMRQEALNYFASTTTTTTTVQSYAAADRMRERHQPGQ